MTPVVLDQTAYLDSLPAYNLNAGTLRALDLARQLIRSNDYYYYGFSFPMGQDTMMEARQTIEDSLSIPIGSYIVSIGCSSWIFDSEERGGAAAFTFSGAKVSLFDKGSGLYLFEKNFGRTVSIGDRPISNQVGHRPRGMHYVFDPMIMVYPGQLQIEVTNLSTTENSETIQNFVQVLINCAVPIRNSTLNTMKMKTQDVNVVEGLNVLGLVP